MSKNSILDDIRNQFSYGSMANRLIIVNVVAFLFMLIAQIVLSGFLSQPAWYQKLVQGLSMPIPIKELLFKPWTIFTYMFMHDGFFHILFNMLWLFWFGQIFAIFFPNDKKILPIYVYGSLFGAALVLVLHIAFPHMIPASYMLGASAGVTALGFACATISPDYTMRLFLFGNVKLKYMLLAFLIMDLVSIAAMKNTGGHFAHIGGGFMGWFLISQMSKGNDLMKPFENLMDRVNNMLAGKKQKPRVVHRSPKAKQFATKTRVTRARGNAAPKEGNQAVGNVVDKQTKIDRILDKISASGYDSLSKEEKEFLFKISKDD